MNHVQKQLQALNPPGTSNDPAQDFADLPDDVVSDDAMETFSNTITLPDPELSSLPDVEQVIRMASTSQGGREALAKFLIREDYVGKIIPLVSMSEDLESLEDLHRLCNIMKSLILLNDNTIIEYLVTDDIITGVIGALEYDPDFPTHKANHRLYLNDTTRYKEVVPIQDQNITKKIRHTWRLQYLKDVVLARILDDPTFSVLNSLIFFNQVEIVQHLQNNNEFLAELFSVFDGPNANSKKSEDGVHFIHQCAAIAKNLQAPSRATLFTNFISHGLFNVITFAIKHPNASLRTTGVDILVALLDHDPMMMRGFMLKTVNDKKTPLTDTMIELLHAETDLGVKNQLADAIKILLDPNAPGPEPPMNRGVNELIAKAPRPADPQRAAHEQFAQDHFDASCKRLFKPLRDLQGRTLLKFSFQDVALYVHLVEILTYFVRSYPGRSREFILSNRLSARVAQLLEVCQKPLKLTALKFFRTCVGLPDPVYVTQMMQNSTFESILNIVSQTMPRDCLLNSACLEMFEYVRRENQTNIILHVVEKYRSKLETFTYVDTFSNLINRFEQIQHGYDAEQAQSLFTSDEDSPLTKGLQSNGQRWQGIKEMDTEQEEYFNTSDDEDDTKNRADQFEFYSRRRPLSNGHPPTIPSSPTPGKPLVDYPDDEDDILDEDMDIRITPVLTPQSTNPPSSPASDKDTLLTSSPDQRRPKPSLEPSPDLPEKLSEKRRREEEDDEAADHISKLSAGIKRRNSTSSAHSSTSASASASTSSVAGANLAGLRRRKSFLRSKQHGLASHLPAHTPTHDTRARRRNSSSPPATPDQNTPLSALPINQATSSTGSTGPGRRKITISLAAAGQSQAHSPPSQVEDSKVDDEPGPEDNALSDSETATDEAGASNGEQGVQASAVAVGGADGGGEAGE